MLMNADASQAGHAIAMLIIPDLEVASRAQPRTFTPYIKIKVLAEFEALAKAERGVLAPGGVVLHVDP